MWTMLNVVWKFYDSEDLIFPREITNMMSIALVCQSPHNHSILYKISSAFQEKQMCKDYNDTNSSYHVQTNANVERGII